MPPTIAVGIFTVSARGIGLVTTDGDVPFAGPLAATKVAWLRSRPLTRACDITTGPIAGDVVTCRVFFARPLPGAARVREDQVTAITDALTSERSSIAQVLGGAAGEAAALGEIIGNLVAAPGELMGERKGRRNGDAVRALLTDLGIQQS
jgi:hypothetical protein